MFYKEWRQTQKQFLKYLVTLFIFGGFFYLSFSSRPLDSTDTPSGLGSAMALYCLVVSIQALFLSDESITKEYRNGTMPFLLMKPVPIMRLLFVKWVVGVIQTAILVVVPLIVILPIARPPLPIDLVILSTAEYGEIILITLSIAIALFSIMFFIRICFEKRMNRNIPLLIGFACFGFFFRQIAEQSQSPFAFGGIIKVSPLLILFSIVTALTSLYLTYLVLGNRKAKRVVREVVGFMRACALALIVLGLAYLAGFFVFIFSPDYKASMVLYRLSFILWGMPFGISGLTVVLSLLLPRVVCAAITYYDSRMRYSSRLSRVLLTAFVSVFSITGLIAYAFYRRKGKLGPCDSCRREKLVYVYPCPYCGYHIA